MADSERVSPTQAAVLERRRIELELLAPIARRLEAEVGAERTAAILTSVIAEIAEGDGRRLRTELSEGGIAGVARLWDGLSAGGALDLEVLELSSSAFRFRVSRCRYAEMYRERGLAPLGHLLSCGRDRPLLQGFAPELELESKGNLLLQGDHCEFSYRLR